MVSPIVVAVATGIGLLTDKYMLEATNFVEHYATEMKPDQHQKEFIKSAMYAGAICGMVTFGPLSDFLGRRSCLILCSVITLAGALLSMCAWHANVLIIARIITGIGMGGEYPLASTHSAESAESSDNGARNVALLYLFGSGGGPILCDFVTYILDVSGMEGKHIWRCIFLVGSILSLAGLVLRFFTTTDSKKFVRAAKQPKGTRRNFLRHYWRPLLGTAMIWCLFDVVEYGLKQNDAAIFAADAGGPYSQSVLTVFCSRLLAIPSLVIAPFLLKHFRSKSVQAGGFAGCCVANLLLALGYRGLKTEILLFDALYIVQLSFQSLPGVTTMAIPAEIFPSAVGGTGSAISAASGKVGAVLGSYFFTMMKNNGQISEIFIVVTCTSTAALILTLLLTPYYSGGTLDRAEILAAEGKTSAACKVLYSGPQEHSSPSEADVVDSDDGLETSESKRAEKGTAGDAGGTGEAQV